MPHCRTIEFLRRRYAAAILRDDAATAGRLRADLDAVMNGAAPAPHQAQRRALVSCAPPPARESVAAAFGPLLQLVTPVTGLLEWSAPRPVAASPRDPARGPTPDPCPDPAPAHLRRPEPASLERGGRPQS